LKAKKKILIIATRY